MSYCTHHRTKNHNSSNSNSISISIRNNISISKKTIPSIDTASNTAAASRNRRILTYTTVALASHVLLLSALAPITAFTIPSPIPSAIPFTTSRSCRSTRSLHSSSARRLSAKMISQQNHYVQQQQHHQHHQQQQESAPVPIFNGVDPNYPGVQKIYNDPPMYRVENFLTPDECDHLIRVASDSFTPAPVVGVGSGVVSETRTSSTCYLAREDLPDLVRKVSRLTRKPICHMELPQVGRYLSSQQYLPHFDAFNIEEADGARFASNGGQRTVTVLVYLNDVASGGHTAFPRLPSGSGWSFSFPSRDRHLEVKPTRGTALVFFPATVDGHLDPRALHAALPAVDTKFVSQIWIRQGNYHGQASKRLAASDVMGAPQLTPQETQSHPATTIADVLHHQEMQQPQQQQQQQQ